MPRLGALNLTLYPLYKIPKFVPPTSYVNKHVIRIQEWPAAYSLKGFAYP